MSYDSATVHLSPCKIESVGFCFMCRFPPGLSCLSHPYSDSSKTLSLPPSSLLPTPVSLVEMALMILCLLTGSGLMPSSGLPTPLGLSLLGCRRISQGELSPQSPLPKTPASFLHQRMSPQFQHQHRPGTMTYNLEPCDLLCSIPESCVTYPKFIPHPPL